MAVDLVQIREMSKKKEDENWDFRLFLKGECDLDSDQIDQQVFTATRRVWAGIDCKTCANCCRELQASFSEAEVDRLARRLGIEREQVIEKYLERTEPLADPHEAPPLFEGQSLHCLRGSPCRLQWIPVPRPTGLRFSHERDAGPHTDLSNCL